MIAESERKKQNGTPGSTVEAHMYEWLDVLAFAQGEHLNTLRGPPDQQALREKQGRRDKYIETRSPLVRTRVCASNWVCTHNLFRQQTILHTPGSSLANRKAFPAEQQNFTVLLSEPPG